VYRWLERAGFPGGCRRFKKVSPDAPHEPEDHAPGRSRGGLGSKFHLVTDAQGLPLAVEVFDEETYRRRSVIEQCVGWLKECRPIGTRFEKPASNFPAMLKLAIIELCLKLTFSDRL